MGMAIEKRLKKTAFFSQAENLTGKKIRVLRTNNGGEYTSVDFGDFCKEAGIKRELVA
jgi:hypothetical protein